MLSPIEILMADNMRLRDALNKTAYVKNIDVQDGNYMECKLCKGVSPYHVVVRAQVIHALGCVLFVETPQSETRTP